MAGYGYKDQQIGPKKHIVKFLGTPATTIDAQKAFIEQRAAELCGDTGYEVSDWKRISQPEAYTYLAPAGNIFVPLTSNQNRAGISGVVQCN